MEVKAEEASKIAENYKIGQFSVHKTVRCSKVLLYFTEKSQKSSFFQFEKDNFELQKLTL